MALKDMSKVYLNTEQRISKINKCWLLHLSSVHSISCTISTGSTINRFLFFGLNHSCFFLHVSWTVSQTSGGGSPCSFPLSEDCCLELISENCYHIFYIVLELFQAGEIQFLLLHQDWKQKFYLFFILEKRSKKQLKFTFYFIFKWQVFFLFLVSHAVSGLS